MYTQVVRACPFCEHGTATREHLLAFHRDRLTAARLYQQALAAGKSVAEARAAANAAVRHRGPGQYDRERMQTSA